MTSFLLTKRTPFENEFSPFQNMGSTYDERREHGIFECEGTLLEALKVIGINVMNTEFHTFLGKDFLLWGNRSKEYFTLSEWNGKHELGLWQWNDIL